jgi:protein MpaA
MRRATRTTLRLAALALVLNGCAARPAETPAPAPSAPTAARPGIIGASVRGAPIEHRVLGRGPLRVLLIGLIHGDEPEGFERFDELWRDLDTPGRAALATLHAVPTMNPDGFADRTRGNARGVDLNRNWPASNFAPARALGASPLSEPETRAVHGLMTRVDPDLVIVFHSTRSGPLVDPDGPADGAAAAFVDAASRVDPRWRVVPDFSNPAGSLGTWAGLDRGVAVLTVEFERGAAPDEALRAARAGVVAAIHHAADGR